MMNYADEYLELANELLTEYSYSDAFYRKIAKDEITGEIITEEEFQIKIVILPSPKYSKETLKYKEQVIDSDYLAYMYPLEQVNVGLNDVIYDLLTDTTFTIEHVVKLAPNGKNILYKLGLK